MENFKKNRFKRPANKRLIGWRYGVFIGGLVGSITLALYPIVIKPVMNPTKWQEIQRETRAGIDPEKIQPGGMRVWSSPYEHMWIKEKKE